jgi:hypothetical protein
MKVKGEPMDGCLDYHKKLDKLGKFYVVMLVRSCLVHAWRVAFSKTGSIHLLPFPRTKYI